MMESSSLPQESESERFQCVGLFETCTSNHPEYEHTDRRITIVSAQAFLRYGLQQLKRVVSQLRRKLAGKNMDIKTDMKTWRHEERGALCHIDLDVVFTHPKKHVCIILYIMSSLSVHLLLWIFTNDPHWNQQDDICNSIDDPVSNEELPGAASPKPKYLTTRTNWRLKASKQRLRPSAKHLRRYSRGSGR